MGLFKKGIHPALAQKLVEIGQLKSSDSLDNWYEKALSFERSRREAIEEFEGERKKVETNLGKDKTTSVLDVLRQDPNAMEVDKCKEQRKCYNCGETGHFAARCFKPKRGRVETRIVEKGRKDFSQGRE